MNTPVDEQPGQFEQHTRKLFDGQVASLDARTLSRLNRARQVALDVARKDRIVLPRWLMPAGSVAALALVAVVTFQYVHVAPPIDSNGPGVSAMEDMEIIASNEELDLLQDVDFYDWVDTADSESETG